jgi:hypothetical protein
MTKGKAKRRIRGERKRRCKNLAIEKLSGSLEEKEMKENPGFKSF